jgi:predicted DNA-binding protein
MSKTKRAAKPVRRSVTLPPELANRIDSIAQRRRLPNQRVLVELIEHGIEARNRAEREFFELAKRFREASDPDEVNKLGDELGKFVFGD